MLRYGISALCCTIALAPPADAGARPAVNQVTIRRDSYGVPHIYANSTFGIFYGYGYALAEDNLFQMDLMRRTAKGSVAEVLGERYLEDDKATRGAYDPDLLQREYALLAKKDQAIFEGIAAGYNARLREVLASRTQLLPYQFSQFGFDPSPWSSLDVISVWVHWIAIRFCDVNSEIENLALLTRLRARFPEHTASDIFDQLRWEYDPLAPTTIAAEDERVGPRPTFAARPAHSGLAAAGAALAPLSATAAATREADDIARYGGVGPDAFPHASNVWLAGPKKTTHGETVIVNGPQMGHFTPGYFWSVGLHGAGFDVVGSGPAGSPWLILGTNGRIAWGSTAGFGDTVDIYQETLQQADSHRYLYQGDYRAMEKRSEIIAVRGSVPIVADYYSTVHGPVVLFDSPSHTAYAKKRSWAGSLVQSLVAWVESMKAQDYTQWRASLSHVTLGINNYYADRNGNIGYVFLGRFPIRPPGQDFRLPATGDGSMEWQGFLPFDTNPTVLNPHKGYIANWNNKPQPSYNSSDSNYWGAVDHLNEIQTIFDGQERFAPEELWNIIPRTAFTDDNARYFLPLVADAAKAWPAGSAARAAADVLQAWDGRSIDPAAHNLTSRGQLLFQRFLSTLIRTTVAAQLPDEDRTPSPLWEGGALSAVNSEFPTLGTKVMYNALLGVAAGVPQHYDFIQRPRADAIRAALEAAAVDLTSHYGAKWEQPIATHVFGTVNYAGIQQTLPQFQQQLPVRMNRGTENNMIVLAADHVSYCDVTPPGESGLISPDGTPAPHFKDQLALYGEFRCKQQWLNAGEVERDTKSMRVLTY